MKQFFLAKLDDQKYFKKNPPKAGAKCQLTTKFEWSDFEIKAHKKTEEEPEKPKAKENPMNKEKPDHNILNILRRIILRLRPYMSPNSSPALAFKAL